MSEARGFWKGGDLWWRIGAEEISDRELRSWVHHNMTGINRHVGKCILKLRAEAVSLRRDFGKGERLKGGPMELSDIEITSDPAKGFQAELRADAPWGGRGNWIVIGGWGETEAIAREQIEVALKALGLTVDGIGKALTQTR